MSVGLRITEVRNKQKKNIFAIGLGITADYLRMLESDEKTPGKTLIKLICHKFNLSEEWLLRGNGEKYSTPIIHINNNDSSARPLLPVNIYNLDSLSDYDNTSDIAKHLGGKKPLSIIVLSEEFTSDNMIAMKVPNNAMTPEIKKNSIVGVNINKTDFEDGGLYIVKTPELDISIRHIYSKPNSLTLVPNNKDFPEIDISKKYLEAGLILGTITWILQEA